MASATRGSSESAHSNHTVLQRRRLRRGRRQPSVGVVPVRDGENLSGPVVTVGAGAWQSFVDALR
ncbi:DUF397 domain-containing protein [Streptomyces sp. NPDC052535]|uniref:DUF397 domain-containing protein n=1 Tax=unclassified Streptomyces TaxID=2593676 RepID=UPI0034335389